MLTEPVLNVLNKFLTPEIVHDISEAIGPHNDANSIMRGLETQHDAVDTEAKKRLFLGGYEFVKQQLAAVVGTAHTVESSDPLPH